MCTDTVIYLNNYKRKEVIIMPRTKGSKNRPKTNITKGCASQIAEKQDTIMDKNKSPLDNQRDAICSEKRVEEDREHCLYVNKQDKF